MNRIETKIIVMVTNKLAAAKECDAKTELIEELSENLYQRYLDLTAAGVPEQEALQQAMDSLGDVKELLEYLAYLSEEDGGAKIVDEVSFQDLEPLQVEGPEIPRVEWQEFQRGHNTGEQSQRNSSYNKRSWSQSFNTDKLEKGIEDIISMAMSAARGAVDMASDMTRNFSDNVTKTFKNFEFSGDFHFDREADKEKSHCEIPCDQIHSLDVNLFNGDIRLEVDDEAENITLMGDMDNIESSMGEDGVLRVRQRNTAGGSIIFGRGVGWADLDIMIPFKSWNRIGLQSTAGDISLEDSLVCNALYMNTKSGDINLDGGSSLIHAEKMAVRTLSGDVNASGLVGSLYINSTSGDITVEDCQLKTCGVITTSGDVSVECDVNELSCSSASGDVEITAIDQMPAVIKAATTSGDVRLEMVAADGLTLAYRTVSGDISYDVDDLDQWTEQRESGKKGAIIYRNGQPGQVQLSTVSGDIDLTLQS